MTYFITAKQIVEYKAESERPTSKKETNTNGKRTKYLLFFGNRNTFHSKMKNPHLWWKGLQSTKMSQLIWSVTIPFRHLRCLFYPLHRGAFGIKRLSRGGESIVEFYIFSALQWESCGIIVFRKLSCGTYVIVVLLNMRNFLWLARRFLAWYMYVEFLSLSREIFYKLEKIL